MATVLRVAASAAMCQRADAQVTGLAPSAESTTSHLGTRASSAKSLVLRAAVATASAAAAAASAARRQAARATGSARNAKSTTSRHVTFASAAKIQALQRGRMGRRHAAELATIQAASSAALSEKEAADKIADEDLAELCEERD